MDAVLITGAGSGIGLSCAQKFSDQGFFVFLNGRDEKKLKAAALTLKGPSEIIFGSINEDKVRAQLVEKIKSSSHSLKVLINNAGTFIRGPIEEMNDLHWNEQFEIHVKSPALLIKELLPFLKKNSPSSILNISSSLGAKPTAGISVYSAMKAAQCSLTQSLAAELGPSGIRVNALLPGIVDTPIHNFYSAPAPKKKEILEGMAKLQPLGRIGESSEIAESAYFLCSKQSAWTTGALVIIDGGINLT